MEILNHLFVFLASVYLSLVPAREVREGVIQQPDTFFPMQTDNTFEKTVSKLIFRGLFKYNIFGELENDLVDTYQISENGLEYTITIKKGQYWIDGTEINSDDIIYSSINSPSLAGVAIDRVDDYTIRYTLQNKYAPFLSLLTQGIIKNNSIESSNSLIPITSGDFRVLNVRRSGPIVKEITLYSSKFKIPKLTFKFYETEDDLITAAKLGEIDTFLSEKDDINLESFNKEKISIISYSYGLFYNIDREKFVTKEMRQNMAKVINYKEVAENFGIPVEGVISKDQIFTNKKIVSNKYDSKFEQDNQEKKIYLKSTDTERNKKVIDLLERYFDDSLGYDLQVEYFNNNDFLEQVIKPKDYDIIFYGIETQRDPDRYVNWHSSGIAQGYNFTNFRNPTIDKTLEDGRSETDLTKRVSFYNKFQEVFDQNLPAIYLFHPTTNYYFSKRITGIGEKYAFDVSDRFLDYFNWVTN